MGTLIEVLSAPGVPSRYLVEMVRADGATIWLSEFGEAELAPALRS